MTLDVSTPALVFPATTLLILAYTQRFSHLSDHIRQFVETRKTHDDEILEVQIQNFQQRIYLVQRTEAFGVLGLIMSLLSSLSLVMEMHDAGMVLFIMSLVCILISLTFSLWEILLSTDSLQVLLRTQTMAPHRVKSFLSHFRGKKKNH